MTNTSLEKIFEHISFHIVQTDSYLLVFFNISCSWAAQNSPFALFKKNVAKGSNAVWNTVYGTCVVDVWEHRIKDSWAVFKSPTCAAQIQKHSTGQVRVLTVSTHSEKSSSRSISHFSMSPVGCPTCSYLSICWQLIQGAVECGGTPDIAMNSLGG